MHVQIHILHGLHLLRYRRRLVAGGRHLRHDAADSDHCGQLVSLDHHFPTLETLLVDAATNIHIKMLEARIEHNDT